ncbi:hypothetical protein HB848_00235 [Listeria rocourtiae]|uniref:hypothetical protein n=1 Tax=Listeria rocourtiae TaxID=647910 RepID=UPI001624F6A7|nr:hypothetical protein [Listeria rocourtiae]MBC1433766.1 hypothetical protein [Listeria rocourtiae]
MADILNSLSKLIPFLSVIVLFTLFLSNQIFDTKLERQLYSNVEKFFTHFIAITSLTGIIAIFSYFGGAKAYGLDIEDINGEIKLVLAIFIMVLLAGFLYCVFLIWTLLTSRPVFYFDVEGEKYKIIKKHKKGVWLCEDLVSEGWIFFTEDSIFNKTKIYETDLLEAKKRKQIWIYEILSNMPRWCKIIYFLSLLGVYLSPGIPLLTFLISWIRNGEFPDFFSFFLNLFMVVGLSTIVIPLHVTYRNGKRAYQTKKSEKELGVV